VFVVMRPLGKQLVLDVDAGDPHTDELTHGAHGVQRLPKTGARTPAHRDLHRPWHIAGYPDLLVQGQQRLGGAARAAGDEPAHVGRFEPSALDQASAQRVISDGEVDEGLVGEKPAERCRLIDHDLLPQSLCGSEFICHRNPARAAVKELPMVRPPRAERCRRDCFIGHHRRMPRSPRERTARNTELPAWIKPQRCQLVKEAPSGDNWSHELKFDGYRLHARIDRAEVRLLTRTGLDWTDKYP